MTPMTPMRLMTPMRPMRLKRTNQSEIEGEARELALPPNTL
jgi:hypothetical protein